MQRESIIQEQLAGEGSLPAARCTYFDPLSCHDLVRSRTAQQALVADDDVDCWITDKRAASHLLSREIPIDQVDKWQVDGATGNIRHISGRFFTITGVRVRHRTQICDLEWDQPIIDQPEIGILGILAKKIDGVLHFCLQAKEEPGNIHSVQLSPTVQATYSNYTRIHGGSLPQFVEHFLDPPQQSVLYAKLQTEDGGRFLFKSNRNMVVLVEEDKLNSLPEGYIWLTLRQISRLMRRDNLVNACARSVLSAVLTTGDNGERAVPCDQRTSMSTPVGHIQWLDDLKAVNHVYQKRMPLRDLKDWGWDGNGHLVHRKGKYFKIIGLQIASRQREVREWCQPIMDNVAAGIIGLLLRRTPQGTEYLMQAKADVGNRNIIQIAPTVQFTQENYIQNERLNKPFLYEEFISPQAFTHLSDSRQSEEGARFYREEHIHRILLLPERTELDLPPAYRWFSAQEMHWFLHFGETVNSCARSILAVCFSTPVCCDGASIR